MKRLQVKKFLFAFLFYAALSFFSCLPTQAAAPENAATPLILQVNIDDPNVFWNCSFMTPGHDTAKPAVIKVEWNIDGISKQTKQATLIIANNETGQIKILTEKNAVLNLELTVWSAKNLKLGSTNMQFINHGQTETVTIAPPERIEPVFTWGNQ